MEGSVTVESPLPIVAVTLRQDDDPSLEFPQEVPTLATFPVIDAGSDELETRSI